jgi:leucyl aminopeptidase (aminopeptidase T)
MTKYEKAAQTIVSKCLDIQKEESVLVMASEPLLETATFIHQACSKKSKNTYLLQLPRMSSQAALLPSITELMQKMHVIIAVTTPSISHTEARRLACRAGARIAGLPGITMNAFSRIADANFDKIFRRSKKLADILSMASEVRVTAMNGTDLFIPISKRQGYADTGILNIPGSFSNLPAGEAAIAPDDGGCEGLLVVDSGLGINADDKEQLSIVIKEGRAVRISGGIAARKLSQQLSAIGANSRVVAEFGIGANEAAQLNGCTLEDEKVLGTIHIGLGNNLSFGGANDAPIHMDAIVYLASVEIDGKQILSRGKLLIE